VIVSEVEPLVAVTAISYVPEGVAAVVLTVSDGPFAGGVTDVGLITQVGRFVLT
jgi:hypothetical protein